ncbi:diaminopimelate decarboxylase [Bacteriovorax sp. Seq25_V]|uniref:diaminopimelate decarboxylase n=1 Tax=Bacteriovorax sp. Seq25_V TaxID=1201288 RepID=UPI00038A365C|nr:diaminopimelate decarboxylase [Bacteriovorax sp. Seq25_V]EQC48018.1 diaminopimelate decarboxylase [Bacteriovorax sp. Seq25_V]
MKKIIKQILHVDNYSFEKIARDYRTPLYIYSQLALEDQYLDFYNSALEATITRPMVCFALKANNNINVLKSLAKLGCGADIVSGGELKQALKAKIPANKIVFSGVGKTAEEITLALGASKDGIYSFNVESVEELKEINIISKKLNKRARISLRLNPEVLAKTHKHISTGHKTHKFGILKEDIAKAVKKKSLWTHCDLKGLSIHIGSQLTCLKATKKAVAQMCQLALDLKLDLEFLDVGGGLGVDYERKENTPSALEYMQAIQESLQKNYYTKTDKRPRIVFEPGRFIGAYCGYFLTKVLRTKKSGDCNFVIVDGGMNDFVRSSLYGAYHEITPVKARKSELMLTDIVGPICETTDCFASKRPMTKLQKDDLIVVEDVGAYGHTMSSTYNMRERVGEIFITKEGKIIS